MTVSAIPSTVNLFRMSTDGEAVRGRDHEEGAKGDRRSRLADACACEGQDQIACGGSAPQRDPEGSGWGADEYRIRVGDVRIVYEVDDDKVVVTVVKVEGRDKVYKKR